LSPVSSSIASGKYNEAAASELKSGRLPRNSISTSHQTTMLLVLGEILGSAIIGATVAPLHKWEDLSVMLYHCMVDGKSGLELAPVPPFE
jgi:hypothetical protein